MEESHEADCMLVIKKILRDLKINARTSLIFDLMVLHPSFPSLSSIHHVLNELGVENKALRIKEKIQILSFSASFIAYLKSGIGSFVLVTEVKENSITYYNGTKGYKTIDLQSFIDDWTGITLFFKKTERSGEPEYYINTVFEFLNTYGLIILSGIVIFMLFNFNIRSLMLHNNRLLTLFLTCAIGLVITSYMTLNQGKQSGDDKFCKALKNNKCNELLNSKYGSVIGISMSSIGLIFFLSFLLFFLSAECTEEDKMHIVKYVSFLLIPVPFISIYIQYKLDKWCIKCLSVMIVIFTMSIIGITTVSDSFSHLSPSIFGLFIKCVLVGVFYALLSRYVLNKNKAERELSANLYRFKRNIEIFKGVLEKQRKFNLSQSCALVFPIINANLHTKWKLSLVLNPLCEICHSYYKVLYELRNKYPNLIQLEIIFRVYDDYNETYIFDDIVKKCSNIIGIYNEVGTQQAFQEMFNISNTELFKLDSDIYKERVISNTTLSILDAQNSWCKLNLIDVVPTLFINESLKPNAYKVKDIEHLIPYL